MKNMFFMCRPIKQPTGKWYIRFYSRHPYPWFQASVRLDNANDVLPHFMKFIDSAREHMKTDHISCNCCYHPRIR